MKYLLKFSLVFVLFAPAMAVTVTIWLFGGWTKGWDYMPNPLYSLISWMQN